MKPDYSEYLTPEHLEAEEAIWATCGYYQSYADLVERAMRFALDEGSMIRSMIEIGCGTGWVPTLLHPALRYTGLDKNPRCIERAIAKNPKRRHAFVCADIRQLSGLRSPMDLVGSFAVLKHFDLSEWDDLVGRVLRLGRYGVFTLPCYDQGPDQPDAYDSGDTATDFPHVWVSRARVARVVAAAGREIVEYGAVAETAETWFMVRSTR